MNFRFAKSCQPSDQGKLISVDPLWSGILAFRYFKVRHFCNSDDKESRLFALKTLKSRNAMGL
jgi:hypothetical protein